MMLGVKPEVKAVVAAVADFFGKSKSKVDEIYCFGRPKKEHH